MASPSLLLFPDFLFSSCTYKVTNMRSSLVWISHFLSLLLYLTYFSYIKHCFLLCVCVCVCVKSLSCVRLFATLWTVAHQAPLSMGFSRQEYWSGLPFSHHYRQLALLGEGFWFCLVVYILPCSQKRYKVIYRNA